MTSVAMCAATLEMCPSFATASSLQLRREQEFVYVWRDVYDVHVLAGGVEVWVWVWLLVWVVWCVFARAWCGGPDIYPCRRRNKFTFFIQASDGSVKSVLVAGDMQAC